MKEELICIVEDTGEFALDSLLPDGVIKDLPIVGPAFCTLKIGKEIHDRIFLEKLKSFIKNIDSNPKWKEKFSDEKECRKIAKQLIYIINACDSDDKANLIGLAFNYFSKGEISQTEYFFVANIIQKSFFPFLKMLLDIEESDIRFKNDGTKYDYTGITHLLNIGVLDYNGQTTALYDQTGKIASPPSTIVTLNGYSDFIKELLNKLN